GSRKTQNPGRIHARAVPKCQTGNASARQVFRPRKAGSSNRLFEPDVAFASRRGRWVGVAPELRFAFSGKARAFEIPLDARKSQARNAGPCFDGFLSAIELVPGDGLNIRAEDEVGVALPDFELVLLRRADGPSHDLENVRGSAAVTVLHANGNTQHE